MSLEPLGMATIPVSADQKTEHPIYELMEHAETRWTNLLSSQSKTLKAAVKEYKRRYGLAPPAGFDNWFSFCQSHGIRLLDDYDQLMKDLLPHHALAPETFIARSAALEGEGFTYTVNIDRNKVDLSGERGIATRPKQLRALIDGFRHALPEGFQLKITGSDHDTGSVVLGRDHRERAMELVRAGDRE